MHTPCHSGPAVAAHSAAVQMLDPSGANSVLFHMIVGAVEMLVQSMVLMMLLGDKLPSYVQDVHIHNTDPLYHIVEVSMVHHK